MKAKHKVLSTKKLEPSLVQQASERGIEIVEKEFINIQPIWTRETGERIIELAKSRKQYAVLTSANAVDMLGQYMKQGDTYYVINWRIFCLSGKTKQAILNNRDIENNIVAEAANATELAEEIIKHGAQEVIFFCGNKRRDELPFKLKEAGVLVHEIVLYETVGIPTKIEEDFEAVLFFSPSAVQSFFAVNHLDKETVCFSIGVTTQKSLKTFTQNRISTSLAPTQEDLLNEVIDYFETGILEQDNDDEASELKT